MISKPTCLVLGAGASVPYGLPAGESLRQLILGRVAKPDDKICSALVATGYAQNRMAEFVEAFGASRQKSVDAFLAHRPDLMLVGKAALAAVLIQHERPEHLVRPEDPSDDWYQHLWEVMQSGGKDAFHENRLAVVSFNYDRSFQRFLIDAYRHSFGVSEDDAQSAIMSTVPLVQVHGSLGRLSSDPVGSESRQYRPTLEPWAIHLAAEQILILSEGEITSPKFKEAQEHVTAAEAVVFLGCAFHDENMRRLGLGPDRRGPYHKGSGYGLTDRERNRARRRWGVAAGRGDWKSLDFLRRKVDLS